MDFIRNLVLYGCIPMTLVLMRSGFLETRDVSETATDTNAPEAIAMKEQYNLGENPVVLTGSKIVKRKTEVLETTFDASGKNMGQTLVLHQEFTGATADGKTWTCVQQSSVDENGFWHFSLANRNGFTFSRKLCHELN